MVIHRAPEGQQACTPDRDRFVEGVSQSSSGSGGNSDGRHLHQDWCYYDGNDRAVVKPSLPLCLCLWTFPKTSGWPKCRQASNRAHPGMPHKPAGAINPGRRGTGHAQGASKNCAPRMPRGAWFEQPLSHPLLPLRSEAQLQKKTNFLSFHWPSPAGIHSVHSSSHLAPHQGGSLHWSSCRNHGCSSSSSCRDVGVWTVDVLLQASLASSKHCQERPRHDDQNRWKASKAPELLLCNWLTTIGLNHQPAYYGYCVDEECRWSGSIPLRGQQRRRDLVSSTARTSRSERQSAR